MRLIDADALVCRLNEIGAEPDYQHKNEDWQVGLILAEDAIYDAPTIAEPQWIPVSERLPEPNRHDALNVDVYYLAQTEFGDMIVASYNESHEGTKWWEQMYSYRIFDDEIVAWMPLPELYEKGADNDRA